MTTLIRTDSDNEDFKKLVKVLDSELKISDGDEHEFYDQFNKIDTIKHAVIVYENEIPIACGAIKQFDSTSMEVKRMFTLSEYRGKGIASLILKDLENWSAELSFEKCILETGLKQPEAIALYHKNGYKIIANYGQYAGIENSKCFQKTL